MDATPEKQDLFETEQRQRHMALFALATRAEFDAALAAVPQSLAIFPVRGPETGLVMVRGRIGGGGDPFNLGEVTVSRATVRLTGGEIGHGQRLGTDRELARLAALFDALSQTEAHAAIAESLAETVAARIEREDLQRASEAAATRVDFFTLVRGDD